MKKIIAYIMLFSAFAQGMNKEFVFIFPQEILQIIFDYHHFENKDYKDIYLVNKNFYNSFSSIQTSLRVGSDIIWLDHKNKFSPIKKRIYGNASWLKHIPAVGYVFDKLSRKILYTSVIRFEDLYSRFKNIQSLQFGHYCNISDEDFKCITLLRNLKSFSYILSDKRLQYISNLMSLQKLTLNNNREITDEGLKHISGLINIRDLNIACSEISDEGIRHINPLTNIKNLSLSHNKITDEGFSYLSSLINMISLSLSGIDQMTDNGLNHLSLLTSIKDLGLAYCEKISDNGFISLHGLTKIRIHGNKLFTNQLIKNCSVLTNIKALDICMQKKINDEALIYLSNFTKLEQLDLTCLNISDDGLNHISNIKNIKRLLISHINIGDKGLKHLSNLTNLKKLDLDTCDKISHEGIKQFSNLKDLKLNAFWEK